ncbi:glycosyltransferase involved in cell wall biosynthesis [Isoptericola sp. CG 20/1183]|uniref:Glycosyltransferase involved in cell wall biosynthesis n=1 Tax=Isoptericola halotolerans TaxID=300560 RepID=A0ABX5EFA3_9MICO|nr:MULTISPECIES: glycosyltransferase [Isoptericola]PRZ08091.1 glycosyltransferase involved in cell wall biosynthesis [Isoptericola halotolerans]PRZ08889.1 glycosyltransferase involved in cell wall biosynthesis [Isoptericola sp. CG 20/1183]
MIVAFGTYDAARHPRAGILVAGLRAHRHTVAELNHPLGFSTAERVRMLRQPWRLPLLLLRLLACWALLVRDDVAHRRAHGAPDALLVGYLGHFDVVLARLLHPRTTVVLDHLVFAADTATDRGAAGLRVTLLRGLDRLALACADVVVLDTDEHRAMLPDPSRGVVVPVGAPDAWFRAHPVPDGGTPAGQGPLRVVFYGLFTPLQGATVMAEALADALPRAAATGRPIEATLVGHGQDYAAARAVLDGVAGVRWLDWVEPEALPALVAGHDVCLGIFSDTPKGLRVVPNKVFQGLAAGCVVVTSDTAPQRRQLGEHLELVPPADPAALADRLLALTDRDRLAAARARAAAARDAVRPGAVVGPLDAALTARGVRP